MRNLLLPVVIVVLGLGMTASSYFMGRKAAMTSLQEGLKKMVQAARAASEENKPEPDILQDPPEAKPVETERQMEVSLASLEAMRETAEPGSLRFDNPDVVNLLVQFRKRQEYLDGRERRLKELEERLKLEMQNLNVTTQWITKAKLAQDALLNQSLTYIQEEEQHRLQEHGRRLSSLPPNQAISILTNFTPDEIARTLTVVGSTNSAMLLGALVASGQDGSKLAADISKRMMRLTVRPLGGTNSNGATPAKP